MKQYLDLLQDIRDNGEERVIGLARGRKVFLAGRCVMI